MRYFDWLFKTVVIIWPADKHIQRRNYFISVVQRWKNSSCFAMKARTVLPWRSILSNTNWTFFRWASKVTKTYKSHKKFVSCRLPLLAVMVFMYRVNCICSIKMSVILVYSLLEISQICSHLAVLSTLSLSSDQRICVCGNGMTPIA